MKSSKIFRNIIALILAAVMFASPVSVMAQAYDIADSAEEEIAEEEVLPDEPAHILYEDTDMRDENTKQFRMSDGTIQAAQYSVPVHFEQNGEWVDYDNTLDEVDADDSENEKSVLKNKDLTNRTADYSVRLSKKTNGKNWFVLKKTVIKFLGTMKMPLKALLKSRKMKQMTIRLHLKIFHQP